MCKGQKKCSEIGEDTRLWSKKSPLPPPSWFQNEIDLFTEAVQVAAKGDLNNSLKILRKI